MRPQVCTLAWWAAFALPCLAVSGDEARAKALAYTTEIEDKLNRAPIDSQSTIFNTEQLWAWTEIQRWRLAASTTDPQGLDNRIPQNVLNAVIRVVNQPRYVMRRQIRWLTNPGSGFMDPVKAFRLKTATEEPCSVCLIEMNGQKVLRIGDKCDHYLHEACTRKLKTTVATTYGGTRHHGAHAIKHYRECPTCRKVQAAEDWHDPDKHEAREGMYIHLASKPDDEEDMVYRDALQKPGDTVNDLPRLARGWEAFVPARALHPPKLIHNAPSPSDTGPSKKVSNSQSMRSQEPRAQDAATSVFRENQVAGTTSSNTDQQQSSMSAQPRRSHPQPSTSTSAGDEAAWQRILANYPMPFLSQMPRMPPMVPQPPTVQQPPTVPDRNDSSVTETSQQQSGLTQQQQPAPRVGVARSRPLTIDDLRRLHDRSRRQRQRQRQRQQQEQEQEQGQQGQQEEQ